MSEKIVIGEETGIVREKKYIKINGFDNETKQEFYQKIKDLIKVVSKTEYHNLLAKRKQKGSGWATYLVNFDTTPQGKILRDILVVINKDSLPEDPRYLEAVIRHEAAEIWALGKAGFSLVDSALNQNIQGSDAINLAHSFARLEEYRYAEEMGILEEYRAWWKKRENGEFWDPEDKIYETFLKRKKGRQLRSKLPGRLG